MKYSMVMFLGMLGSVWVGYGTAQAGMIDINCPTGSVVSMISIDGVSGHAYVKKKGAEKSEGPFKITSNNNEYDIDYVEPGINGRGWKISLKPYTSASGSGFSYEYKSTAENPSKDPILCKMQFGN